MSFIERFFFYCVLYSECPLSEVLLHSTLHKPKTVNFLLLSRRPADLWHNFPLTMKKMNSATWMLSGQDYLENGEVVTTSTKRNLKELQVNKWGEEEEEEEEEERRDERGKHFYL